MVAEKETWLERLMAQLLVECSDELRLAPSRAVATEDLTALLKVLYLAMLLDLLTMKAVQKVELLDFLKDINCEQPKEHSMVSDLDLYLEAYLVILMEKLKENCLVKLMVIK